jgi:hypothetical protein
MEEYVNYDGKAPFNMAIATLMSLRQTLDHIRNIEGRIDYPASERQRIKIELVKRFYVDSSPLINNTKILDKYKWVIQLVPKEIIAVNNNLKRKKKIIYCHELNAKLDEVLMNIQLEMQKSKYFMPPSDDMSTIGAKMS